MRAAVGKMGLLNGMGDGDSNPLQLHKKIGDFTFPDSRSFVSCKVKTKNNLRSQRTVTSDKKNCFRRIIQRAAGAEKRCTGYMVRLRGTWSGGTVGRGGVPRSLGL